MKAGWMAGRPYCEAFPYLDVHDVLRAFAAGHSWIQWVDQDDVITGCAVRLDLTGESARFFYIFHGTRNLERSTGQLDVEIRHANTGGAWNKPSFVCPQCGGTKVRLYYARAQWSCKSCHDFINIAQRMDPASKSIYHNELMRTKIKAAPKTAAGRRMAAGYKKKLGRAARTLADTHRNTLPERLVFRSYGRWLEPGEAAKTSIVKDEVGYGWEPGEEGQFNGLERKHGSQKAVSIWPQSTGAAKASGMAPEGPNGPMQGLTTQQVPSAAPPAAAKRPATSAGEPPRVAPRFVLKPPGWA